MYFVTLKATPLLNTPHFQSVFGAFLPFDDQHLVREVEMVALPEMIFTICEDRGDHILEVETNAYSSKCPLFIDKRFGMVTDTVPQLKKKSLPLIDKILEVIKSREGIPYVWGGNYAEGISDWEIYYPIPSEVTEKDKAHWMLKGLDCSGLLYEACEGMVPRNTSGLIQFGKEVSVREIKPLDLIIYPGHVIIALNDQEVIESRSDFGGVIRSPLRERLSSLEKPFSVRRFHPNSFQTP